MVENQHKDVAGFREKDDWPTIGQLAKGYDEYTLPDSNKMAAQKIILNVEGGARVQHHFLDKQNVRWTILDGGSTNRLEAGQSGDAKYRALQVRDEVFFIDFYKESEEEEVTIIFNSKTGQAILGISAFHDVNGTPRTLTTLLNAHRDGMASSPFQVTDELLGKVVLYKYNARDVYEHSYQNPGTFAWHCLSGIEKGVASSDPCKFFKLDDQLYLIWWSETVMPVESMVVSDLKFLRSTGRFFCWDPKPRKPMHMVFGSYATVAADLKAKRNEVMAKI